jgi:phosphonopyruvate decarboxylase
MGTASAIGLGVAVNCPGRPTIVIDGDGAALMKLGTLSTIGASGVRNLIHIILDNEVHDSTGGQATASRTTRFAEVASAANYRNVCEATTLQDFRDKLTQLTKLKGPSLIHLKVKAGSLQNLGRPGLSPVEVKDRFMDFLRKAPA